MSGGKPKGRTPSLISGKRPRRVKVSGKVKCARCKNEIIKSQDCFCVPRTGFGPISPRKFC